MAGQLFHKYRDQIFIALLIAFFLYVPSISIKVHDAMGQTVVNKENIEQTQKEIKERTEKQRKIDREQNAKQAAACAERQVIKSEMNHIRKTVDRIEKKLGN